MQNSQPSSLEEPKSQSFDEETATETQDTPTVGCVCIVASEQVAEVEQQSSLAYPNTSNLGPDGNPKESATDQLQSQAGSVVFVDAAKKKDSVTSKKGGAVQFFTSDQLDDLREANQFAPNRLKGDDASGNNGNKSAKDEEEEASVGNLEKDLLQSKKEMQISTISLARAPGAVSVSGASPKGRKSSSTKKSFTSSSNQPGAAAILAYSEDLYVESGTIDDIISIESFPTSDIEATNSERPGAYAGTPGEDYTRIASLRNFSETSGAAGNNTDGEQAQNTQQEPHHFRGPANMMTESESRGQPSLDSASRQQSRVSAWTASSLGSQPNISAVRVDEHELELTIREQLNISCPQAEVVDVKEETREMKARIQRKYIALILLLVVVIVVAVVVFTRVYNRDNKNSQKNAPDTSRLEDAEHTTLQSISRKGHLNCGVTRPDHPSYYFDYPEYEKLWQGFHGDICRAIAAAALDGDANVTLHAGFVEYERWEALENGTIDLLITGTPGSTASLYYDLDPDVPVTFSTPFLYDGVGVAGLPQYVDNCARAEGLASVQACNSVKVCALQGSTALDMFENILHPSQIVEVGALADLYKEFSNACCNMIASDWMSERAELTVRRESNYTGPYKLGGEALYSRQPFAVATRKVQQDRPPNATTDDAPRHTDPQFWSEFVEWVTQALIAAEQNNIDQSTAAFFPQTQVFGKKYQNAFRHAVAAVGNYGEIYERNAAEVVPRNGMNLVNNGSTGLHFHQSIGDVSIFRMLDQDGTLAAVKRRGKLVCGIPLVQNSNITLAAAYPETRFLTNEGIDYESIVGGATVDIEFCRALASSIFQGLAISTSDSCLASNNTETNSDARIEFVLLSGAAEGYTKLDNGELDVIAGRLSLQSDVKEPTTGKGFSFSQPYYYGAVAEEEHVTRNNRCLVTRQDDSQWSDYVHLVVMGIFYAEEHAITQEKANAMPAVNHFGPTYKRMLRDAVFGVGNYGEVFGRLEEARTGPNLLNLGGGPQLSAMPGII